MTPKEKAKELVGQYLDFGFHIKRAKQCALICVDEILKIKYNYLIPLEENEKYNVTYWQEVKQEINKL